VVVQEVAKVLSPGKKPPRSLVEQVQAAVEETAGAGAAVGSAAPPRTPAKPTAPARVHEGDFPKGAARPAHISSLKEANRAFLTSRGSYNAYRKAVSEVFGRGNLSMEEIAELSNELWESKKKK
jgi:hypothetical protein